MKTPVAIVGIGCIFPDAPDLARYWANIKRGHDAIREVPKTHWAADAYFRDEPAQDFTYARRGGFIPPVDFDPLAFGILPDNLEATDTTQLLGMLVAQRALDDAGFDAKQTARDKVSVVLGITGTLPLVIPLGARLGHPIWRQALAEAGVEGEVAEDVVARIADAYVPWKENSFPGLLGNVVAGRIANRLDLHGTNCVVDAACASSLSAAHLAAMELESGRADLVVTGGLDTFNDIFMYMCFSQTPALSPTGDARPFAASGDGTILGEGLGIVVLKRLDEAEANGDRVYAVLRAMGTSSDGKGQAIYAPSAAGQERALRAAYEGIGAKISPDTIELVESHGTGTRVGDAIEATALTAVYREARAEGTWCALGSVKSQIGHTKAAAGAAGLIKAALALHHRVLPPTLKVDRPLEVLAPGTTPFYVNSEARPWLPPAGHPRRAAVSAFGFGGSNFHCVLEEHVPSHPEVDWTGTVQVVPFCAGSREQLAEAVADFEADAWEPERRWPELRRRAAKLRAAFDPQAPFRLAFACTPEGGPDLARLRTRLLDAGEGRAWSSPDGVSFQEGACGGPGGLAFLFPGQGAQALGMLRDLACTFSCFQDALAGADAAFAAPGGDRTRLSDHIYPHSLFDDAARDEAERVLRSTEIAQPALGAVGLGALEILRHFGLEPDAVAGHSYGELLALHTAGVFDRAALFALSRARGELMAGLGTGGTEAGSMLAVRCELSALETILEGSGLDLVIANRNTPVQNVLSGARAAIDTADTLLTDRGVATTRLHVAAAFHSPLVAKAEAPLREALEAHTFEAPRVPVFANTTAQPYPADPSAARALLASQLARPVEFRASIEAMHAAGVRTFVEVGPGARLRGMVQQILQSPGHSPGERPEPGSAPLAVALDASGGRRDGMLDLGRLLAQLAVAGHPVCLERWDPEAAALREADTRRPKLSVPLSGANHVSPRKKRPPRPRQAPASVPRPTGPEATPSTPTTHAAPRPTPTQVRPMHDDRGDDPRLEALSQNLQALLQMQAQTADLHRLFLQGQEAAQASFRELIARQQGVLTGETLAAPVTVPAAAPGAPAMPVAGSNLSATAPSLPAAAPSLPAAAPSLPAAAPSLPAAAAAASNLLAPALLQIVADRTGYPLDVLELEMDLDTDLGIDSIKRVEILSALQAQIPGLPAPEPEALGKLNTLGEIVAHLEARGAADASASTSSPAASPTLPPTPAAGDTAGGLSLATALLEVVAEKTGYPLDVLELEMDLDTDLGIDSIKRVEILSALQAKIPGLPAPEPEALGKLHTLGEIVAHLEARDAAETPASASSPTAPPAPATGDTTDGEALATALLEVVAEKTGYPVDVLELEMDLDTDLGIDSIKRVEILSALQARIPGLPAPEPEALAELRTLGAIVEHLGARATASSPATPDAFDVNGVNPPDHNGVARAAPAQEPGAPETPDASSSITHDPKPPLARSRVQISPVERRGESVPLAPDAPVWITDDGAKLTRALASALEARGLSPTIVSWDASKRPACPEALAGLIFVAPTPAPDPAQADAPHLTGAGLVASALTLLQSCHEALQRAAASGGESGALIASLSHLDGRLGQAGSGASGAVAGAALAGLVKTAHLEWPAIRGRALDLDPAFSGPAHEVLSALLQEGPLELGLSSEGLCTLTLHTETVPEGGWRLGPDDRVLLTGGARGVTAEAALAIAEATGATLLLLGRSAAPEAEPAWLAGLRDARAIKRALIERSGGNGALAGVEAKFRKILRARELRQNLARLAQAGSKVIYRAVDVRNAAALRAVITELEQQVGAPTVVIHGAGVLADAKLTDKTEAELERVWSTKVEGFEALRAALGETPLKALAFFSSTTARLGRAGQADYAAANEALNKLAHLEQARRPQTRVVSIGWGPWEGGMVTQALARLFAAEGVPLIPLRAGARLLLAELQAPVGSAVETVVLGLETPALRPAASVPSDGAGDGMTNGANTGASNAITNGAARPHTRAFSLTLDPATQPFLQDHVIAGQAVLPLALSAEWLAQAALLAHPELTLLGFDDLRLLRGVRLAAGERREIELRSAEAVISGEHTHVAAHLQESAGRPNVRAQILLGPATSQTSQTVAGDPGANDRATELSFPFAREALYEVLFHGPALQAIEQVSAFSASGITAEIHRAPAPSRWLARNPRETWALDPLALDAAFQLAILWSVATQGEACLPARVTSYRQWVPSFPETMRLRATLEAREGQTLRLGFEWSGPDGLRLATARGVEMILDPGLTEAFRERTLAQAPEARPRLSSR